MDIDHATRLDPGRAPADAPAPRRSARVARGAAAGVLVLTLASWGGRMALLIGAPAPDDVLRIGGSVLVGLGTAAVLAWRGDVPTWLAGAFVGWNVVVWTRAVVVAWLTPPSLAFALVHTALGIAWAGTCWAVWRNRVAAASA